MGTINEDLGISEKRCGEIYDSLGEAFMEALKEDKSVAVFLKTAYDRVKGLPDKEIFFAGLLVGRFIERNEMEQRLITKIVKDALGEGS